MLIKNHFQDFWRELLCAGLAIIAGVFLVNKVFYVEEQAFADDGTPIRSDTGEYFISIYDQGSSGGSLIIKTGRATVAEILAKSGIIVAETDIVEPSLDTEVTSDYAINIYRARPAIVSDGTVRRYLMTASFDPRQIATEAGFTVFDGDTVVAATNVNFLEAGAASSFQIIRGGGNLLTVDESLPYETIVRYDYSMPRGTSYLEQPGTDGRRTSVYEVKFEHGVEVSRELISEEVKLGPIPEIVVEGAKLDIPPEQEACAGWIRETGVSEEDLPAALELVYHESGCRVNATNSYSGAYGIPQALPGSKMAAFGDDWETNPVTQIRWMSQYVETRYGGWQEALDYWWCLGVCSSRLGTITKNGYWY